MLSRFIQDAGAFMSGRGTAVVLLFAIFVGSVLGLVSPEHGAALSAGVDITLLAFVFLLLFEVRFLNVLSSLRRISFIAIALVANFVIIPILGYGIASLFLSDHPLFFIGLLIYFSAPCTDWFLGFTRLAKGNTALGAALLPINLIVQLLLYPVYLHLFGIDQLEATSGGIFATVWQWFLVPLLAAATLRTLAERLLKPEHFEQLLSVVSLLVPTLLAVLVGQICASNVTTLLTHAAVVPLILCAVFLFFAATFLLSEGLSKLAGLAYEDRVLLTMTTAARNAPLMLALTIVVIPDQPVVYAALIIGMLVELPHLVALKSVLMRRRAPESLAA
ncbi:MAG: arsenic resistance protein [Pseudomonadota bacterium]